MRWLTVPVALTLLALAVALVGCNESQPTPRPSETVGDEPSAPTSDTTSEATDEQPSATDEFAAEREALVEQAIIGHGIDDPQVLAAMRTVPRHLFVPDEYLYQAYEDHPLPIGYGQTISQPFIVALMTDALELEPGDKVLEVGTGSGYQAAVLAEIVDHIYTIEIIGALAERAEQDLVAAGYENVTIRHADGYFGWEEEAPFDAIIVTAAPDHVPPPLRSQLADGGRMVIPVGPVGGYQELWLIERQGDQFTTTSLGGVVFVPLTRETRDE